MKVTPEFFMQRSRAIGKFSEEALAFQERLLYRTGLGRETYMPRGIVEWPPDVSMASAREEAGEVLFSCFENALKAAKLTPADVDILIVNW